MKPFYKHLRYWPIQLKAGLQRALYFIQIIMLTHNYYTNININTKKFMERYINHIIYK